MYSAVQFMVIPGKLRMQINLPGQGLYCTVYFVIRHVGGACHEAVQVWAYPLGWGAGLDGDAERRYDRP